MPNAALSAVGDTLRENGLPPPATGGATFLQAKTANEVLKSQERRLKLQKLKGELVDRARAEALVFRLARETRDAWVNWPARAAALIAAELGLEPAAMQKVLEAHVRAHLDELAEAGSISDDGSIFAFDGAEALLRAWGGGLKPDPLLTVSEWADRYRTLSSRAAAEPGRYRTRRTPYMKDIMDALSPGHPAQRIVFMKAAQVGATEAGNCFLGFIIHQAPGPALAVQPTVELAKRNSRQRIDPLIEESPALRDKVKPARSRDAGNTMLSKEFAGGILIMTGANSAVGLRSTPARYIFLDEVDAYPASADEEGDPVSLAEARSLTFAHRRKVFLVSTPTIRGLCRIEREFEASRPAALLRRLPALRHDQWLKFERLRWEKGRPETAAYDCEGCDAAIAEHHKTAMLEAGEWRATATSADPVDHRLPPLGALLAGRLAQLGADRPGVGGGAGLGRGDPRLPQHHPRRDLGRDRRGAGLAAALRPPGDAGPRARCRRAGCS